MVWIPEVDFDAEGEPYDTGDYFERPIKGEWDITLLDGIPAWSLHRLIEIVPSTINKMLWFTITPYTALYDSVDYIKSFDSKDNLYDNIIDCIEWLIKEGYFNKEYLENEMEEKA
jgi:hypothetical protein